MIAKGQLVFAILSVPQRIAIFHASPLTSELDALFGGNANQIRTLRELLRSSKSSPKQKTDVDDVRFLFWWRQLGSNQ